jgi:branched-chain amino acid transport system substrate-binding protein
MPRTHRFHRYLLLGALLLAACEAPDERRAPLRLGVIIDASGPSASLGIAGRNGIQLAVEERNERGGIHGRPIELLYRDDGFDAAKARQAGEQLIAAGVEAAIGPMTSTMAEELAPLFTEAGILLMGGTPLSPLLAGRDDMFFRTLSHKNPDAGDIARQLHRLGLLRINVLIDLSNQSFTRPWLDDFQRQLHRLGLDTGQQVEFHRDDQTDFAALAERTLSDQPQAVLLISNALDTALLATQLRLRQPQLTLATPAWAAADTLIEMGGQAVEGMLTSLGFDLYDQSAAFLDVKRRYQARFGQEINTASIASYNATQVLLTALEQRQPGEHLKQTLLRIRRFQGLQYPILFDDFGDSDSPVLPMVIRDGRFVRID